MKAAQILRGLFRRSVLLQLEGHGQADLKLLLARLKRSGRTLGPQHSHWYRRWSRRIIAAGLVHRDHPRHPHAESAGVEVGASASIRNRLESRFVERAFRVVHT